MCGIAGCIAFNGLVESNAVMRMADALAHRGPDGHWHWQQPDGSAAFAYRRLAIIDPQHCLFNPFIWNQKFLVLYNGEIYNYKTLRAELQSKGYTFHSSSDAEVLPALYDCYGESCLEKIDGMFSFALWDIEKKELFCARDRFGEKPFYFSHQGGCFWFASEIKALHAAGVGQALDDEMLFNYLAYNLVENPNNASQTFYKTIQQLPPASWLKAQSSGRVEQQRYWELSAVVPTKPFNIEQAAEELHALLRDSVRTRLQADTSVGCNISGGLDSSALLALMASLSANAPVQTFTARVRDKQLDEGPYVATLLQHVPAKNYEAWIDEGVIIQSLDSLLQQQDEPISDLTILAQDELMKRAAAENMKVLLDGQGADEMLAGYDYFFAPYLAEQFASGIGAFRAAQKEYAEKHGRRFPLDGKFYFDLVAPRLRRSLAGIRRSLVTPPHLRFIHPAFAAAYRKHEPPFPTFNNLHQALHYRTTRYGLHKLLRYADRNGMAHGIEVRFPFLSHKLVEFVFSLPTDFKIHHGWTKYVLRKAMENELPPAVNWRVNKLGYSVPVKTWLHHPKVMEQVKEAQSHLANRKMIKPDFRLSDHQATAVLIASRFVT